MDRHIFITGYPGFIGSKVVNELFEKHNPGAENAQIHIHALVHQDFYQTAQKEVARLSALDQKRIQLIKGDLCLRNFGLHATDIHRLSACVTEIFHIAALYRLDVPEALAYLTNVTGTANILSFALGMRNLKCFNHISTMLVSGKRTGVILEDELKHDAGFSNHYEATKYHSEMLVRSYKDILPIIVYRPAGVAGDSKTGAIGKYDGSYFAIRLYQRMKKLGLPGFLAIVYGAHSYSLSNVVPVDFVAASIVYISQQPEAVGKTFHLVDRFPLTYHELFTAVHDRIFKKGGYKLNAPLWLEKAMCRMPRWVSHLAGISQASMHYLNHVAFWDNRNTEQILSGSGITCPLFLDYLDAMIDFAGRHPDIPMSF